MSPQALLTRFQSWIAPRGCTVHCQAIARWKAHGARFPAPLAVAMYSAAAPSCAPPKLKGSPALTTRRAPERDPGRAHRRVGSLTDAPGAFGLPILLVVGVAPGRRTRGVSESPRDGRSGRHTAPRGRDQGYASCATSLGGPCCACRPSTSSTRDVVGTARARFSATLRFRRRCLGSSGPSRPAQTARHCVLRPKVVNCLK